MATTNLKEMHLRLSRRLQDAVAAETTDGKKVTAANRIDYINRAIKEMQRTLYLKLGEEQASKILQFHVSLMTCDWAAGLHLLPADDIGLPLFLSSASYIYTYYPWKLELDRLTNSIYAYAWTISGGNIYGYENGAAATTACTYYYLKKDEGIADTTDVAVTAIFYDLIVELAYADILQERGEITAQEWSQMKTNAYRGVI
jgi:hypothetical protein